MTDNPSRPNDSFWQQFYAGRPELELFNGHSFATARATIEPDNHKCIAPLHQFSLLGVSGPDATTFLQGQLTADVAALRPGNTTIAAHCDAKGRMHANFLLHKLDDNEYWLQLHHSVVSIARDALAKYAVFSKVSLSEPGNEYACFGVEPAGYAAMLLQNQALKQLVKVFSLADLITCVWLPRAELGAFLELISSSHTHWVGSAEWQKTAMRRGVGFIEKHSSGEIIPQMLNLDCLDGISFTKGCYTGQEIIARMKYRGSVKRRCWYFSAELSSFEIGKPLRTESIAELAPCALPGAAIYDESGQVVGQVVNSVVNSLGSACGLAIVKLAQLAPESTCYLRSDADTNGFSTPAKLTPPPYAIPNN
ncbi:MAG: folate-binding protein YgfZ [Pseudomonadales bacterium]|nr:hypothetical protein [Gammaproteobacteria bacterium]NNL57073.1 folate-binding protein YgfZ [Pseudomonadales bacterium]